MSVEFNVHGRVYELVPVFRRNERKIDQKEVVRRGKKLGLTVDDKEFLKGHGSEIPRRSGIKMIVLTDIGTVVPGSLELVGIIGQTARVYTNLANLERRENPHFLRRVR